MARKSNSSLMATAYGFTPLVHLSDTELLHLAGRGHHPELPHGEGTHEEHEKRRDDMIKLNGAVKVLTSYYLVLQEVAESKTHIHMQAR